MLRPRRNHAILSVFLLAFFFVAQIANPCMPYSPCLLAFGSQWGPRIFYFRSHTALNSNDPSRLIGHIIDLLRYHPQCRAIWDCVSSTIDATLHTRQSTSMVNLSDKGQYVAFFACAVEYRTPKPKSTSCRPCQEPILTPLYLPPKLSSVSRTIELRS